MKIHFISINNLINIPSIRFIVDFFIEKFKCNVIITERAIVNQNNYFENNENVIFDNIDESKSIDDFKSENTIDKFKKYYLVIRKIRKLQKEKNDNIIFVTPDFQVLYFVIKLQKIFKHKNFKIFYLQFELFEYQGRLNNFFNNYLLRNAHIINLAIFPEINRLNHFLNQCLKPPKETFVLPNSCEPIKIESFVRHKILKSIPNDAFIVGHVGNVGGTDHYFKEIIQAAEKLSDENIYFVFIGRQSDEVKNIQKNIYSKKILFFDKIPHQELSQIYPFFNIGLILYKGLSPNFEYAAPNKLYEYWAWGIKSLAHPLKGLKGVFNNEVQGQLINFENQSELICTIKKLSKIDFNKNELKIYFNKNISISIFLKALIEKI